MNEYYKPDINQVIDEIESFEDSQKQKVQFSYLGAFDEVNLSIINEYIEFAQSMHMQKQRTNLFKIFVELTQNISDNSTIRKEVYGKKIGCGKLVIIEYEKYFIMISSNPAKIEDIKRVQERVKEINSKNKDELRVMRREKIKEKARTEANGNIGLIKIAIVTGNKIDISTKFKNEKEGYISIAIILDKQ